MKYYFKNLFKNISIALVRSYTPCSEKFMKIPSMYYIEVLSLLYKTFLLKFLLMVYIIITYIVFLSNLQKASSWFMVWFFHGI